MSCNALKGSILGQIASSSKVNVTPLSLEESIQYKIFKSCAKELPQWAFPYSSRRLLSTSVATRKPKDNFLHLASINLDEDAAGNIRENETSLQILLEWKSLKSRLREHRLDKQAIAPPLASLPSMSFDSNASINMDQSGLSNGSKKCSAVKSRDSPLWITTLDHALLASATHSAMLQIRCGERDIKKLTKEFFDVVEGNCQPHLSREICLEEIRLYLLSQWVARVDKALTGRDQKSAFVKMCLEISFHLYQSSISPSTFQSGIQAAEHANLRMIQQATLHRLFETAYISFSPNHTTTKNSFPKQALMLMSLILQDPRLRPAQNRHLCHKFLHHLRSLTESRPLYRDNLHLWSSVTESFLRLIRKGVISNQTSLSTKEPIVDNLINLICLARSKRHLSRSRAYDILLSLARTLYGMTLARDVSSSDLTEASDDLEKIFANASFIKTKTLEEISKLLHRSGDRLLLRQIAFMVPQEQRSFTILLSLMRNWSNVLASPEAEVKSDSIRKNRNARTLGHRTCNISEKIWSEVQQFHLNTSDVHYETKLYQIFGARMASHARSKMPSLVVADLKHLQTLHNNDLSRNDVLSLLPEKGQIDAMRAFLRSGRLARGTKLASEIINKEKGSTEISCDFKVKVLNILLSADLRLRMRCNVMTARRRFSVLLRRRNSIMEQRSYLRLVINRTYRSMKQSIHKMDSLSTSKRLDRFLRSLRMLDRFTTRFKITPNHQTNKILINAINRLGSRFDSKRRAIEKLLGSLDWRHRSVAEVIEEIKGTLTSN